MKKTEFRVAVVRLLIEILRVVQAFCLAHAGLCDRTQIQKPEIRISFISLPWPRQP